MILAVLVLAAALASGCRGANVFFADISNNTVTLTAPYLKGVANITIAGQECAPAAPGFNESMPPCLPMVTRDALCALQNSISWQFNPTSCTSATQPCYNLTTSSSPKACAATTTPDGWCRFSSCLAYDGSCYYIPPNNTIFQWQYTATGLVGVECAPGMVCDASLRCVTATPPSCPGTVQCVVSGVAAGVHNATVVFLNGSSAVVPAAVTALPVPTLQHVLVGGAAVQDPLWVEASATTPFEMSWLDGDGANFTLRCATRDERIITAAATSFDVQDELVAEDLAAAVLVCVAVADYGALGFVAEVPGAEVIALVTAVPHVYSTCPSGIYAGVMTFVDVEGDLFAAESNLTCIVDGVAQPGMYITRGAVRCQVYWPNETLAAPASLALTVSNDGITAAPPVAIAVIGSCANIKPNSIPNGVGCICPPGFFDADTYCQPCAAGTYQPDPAQRTCLACGADQTTLPTDQPLVSSALCVCRQGFYAPSNATAACAPCPAGFTCNGTATTVNAGFWRAAAGQMFATPCANAAQCPGGTGAGEELCGPAYEGALCRVCRPGYGPLGGACVQCPPGGLSGFMLAAVVCAGVAVVGVLVRATATFEFGTHGMGVTFKVAFAYFQILYYVGKLAARWSSQSGVFFAALVPVTLSPSFVAVQCAARTDFYTEIGVLMAFPAVAWVAVALFYAAHGLWLRHDEQGRRAYPWLDINDDRVKATLVVWYLVHPVIAEAVVRSLRCVAVPGTGTAYLVDNPEVDCASAAYLRYVPLAWCYTVFYVLGFIAYLVVNIYWYAPDVLANHTSNVDVGIGKRFVFFVRGYTPDAYLWEFAVILRKLGVVAADALLPPEIQLVWALLVVGASLAATLQVRPYAGLFVNYLDDLALTALLFTVVLGLHQRLLADPDSGAVFVLLVLVNSAVGAVVVAAMFRSARHVVRRPFDWLARILRDHLDADDVEMDMRAPDYIPPGVVMHRRKTIEDMQPPG